METERLLGTPAELVQKNTPLSSRSSRGGGRKEFRTENATWGYVVLFLVVTLVAINAAIVITSMLHSKQAEEQILHQEIRQLATQLVQLQNDTDGEKAALKAEKESLQAMEDKYNVLVRREEGEVDTLEALKAGDKDRHRQIISLRDQMRGVVEEVDAMNEESEVAKYGRASNPKPDLNDNAGGGGPDGGDPDDDVGMAYEGSGACVPTSLSVFGVTPRVHDSLLQSIEQWPTPPQWAQRNVEKHVNALEWTQELYVRLLRVLYWRYLLPIDYQRGRSRGSDIRWATLNASIFPDVAKHASVKKGPCLTWAGSKELMDLHFGDICGKISVIDEAPCSPHRTERIMGGSQEHICADPQTPDEKTWQAQLGQDHGSYELAVSMFDFQRYNRPWEVATRIFRTVKPGGHIFLGLPSITQNADTTPNLHRWTVEGAKSMLEGAGFCVIRVVPLSNMAVTVGGLLGFVEEDFTLAEHKFTDPVAPHGVAVLAKRCVDTFSVSEDQTGKQCCRYNGAGIRKVIDCWRGLYGQKDEKSAHDWGCNLIEELQYQTWGDKKAWYQMDWTVQGTRAIPGFDKKSAKSRKLGHAGEHCHSEVFKYLGFSDHMEQEMEVEIAKWPLTPKMLTGELKLRTDDSHYFQELFLRIHRIMYWKQLVPMDINMGWQRGSPLDRVYLEHTFFDDIKKRGLKEGSCLEWGNTYMTGALKDICPHQYEITEQIGPCGEKLGQFKNSENYTDYRPFHSVHSDGKPDKTFSGGYCADIHKTQGIIPDNFFNFVISTYVFEHLHSPWLAIDNIYKMTAPGGYLIWAAPNNEIYHANPGDYWRYTPQGAARLIKEAGFCLIKVTPCSNTMVTSGFFMGAGDNDFTLHEHQMLDPVGSHTTAVLAVKPDGSPDYQCPPYEGVNLELSDCWRGETDKMSPEMKLACKTYTARKSGWDGAPLNIISRSDDSTDVRE